LQRRDYFFIFLMLLIGLISLFIVNQNSKNADMVKITVDGKLFCEKPLNENCEIKINDTNVAVIENNTVYMKSATCKDKLCVHMGKAKDSSKKIICLPNKVVIELTKKSDIDMVVK